MKATRHHMLIRITLRRIPHAKRRRRRCEVLPTAGNHKHIQTLVNAYKHMLAKEERLHACDFLYKLLVVVGRCCCCCIAVGAALHAHVCCSCWRRWRCWCCWRVICLLHVLKLFKNISFFHFRIFMWKIFRCRFHYGTFNIATFLYTIFFVRLFLLDISFLNFKIQEFAIFERCQNVQQQHA